MRNVIALTSAVCIGACGGAASDPQPTSKGAVYRAVFEAVSQAREPAPLLHPGTIRVDSVQGSFPGHRSEHYDLGEAVRAAVGDDDITFCTEREDGTGCDVEEGSWVVLSQVAGTLDRPIVWATLVEESLRGRALRYYRADLTGNAERYRVDLTLLATEN